MEAHSATAGTGNGKENEKMTAASSAGEDAKVESTRTAQSPEMLLLEDSTLEQLPEHCKQLMSYLSDGGNQATQADILAILVYCIGLESGFVLAEILQESQIETVYWGSPFHTKNIQVLAKLPSNFKFTNRNFYEFILTLYTYTGSMQCYMIGIQTDGSFIVTLTPDNGAPGYSICLPISRFVLSMKSRTIAARFRNLRELSFELKEHIFGPARNCLVEMSGGGLYAGLCGVPSEVIYLILKKLEMKFVQNLSKTCWKMRALCEAYYKFKSQPSTSSMNISLLSTLSDL